MTITEALKDITYIRKAKNVIDDALQSKESAYNVSYLRGIRHILDVQEAKIQEECNEYYNKYNRFSGMIKCIEKLNPNNKTVVLSKDIADIDKAYEKIDRAIRAVKLSESFSKDIADIDKAVKEIDKAMKIKEFKCTTHELIQARTMLLRQKVKIYRILKSLNE